MDTKLESQLADVIQSAKAAGSDAYAFIQQQAPDVANQIVSWKLAESYVYIIFALVGALVAVGGIFLGRSIEKKNERSDAPGFLYIVGFMVCMGCIVGAGYSALSIAKCKTAPKLVVMEVVASAIKK